MRIFDCFMYYNEDVVLELRLNYLNQFVDEFVIVESTFNHRGQEKKLNFNINNFSKFKDKIKYLILDSHPPDIEIVNDNDLEDDKSRKYILNGYKRDHFQRNYLIHGINNADPDDIIIISDIDEIPNLEKVNLKEVQNQLFLFNQKMCYYKFNLFQKNYNWVGSRACKKKKFINTSMVKRCET